tara:strand:- start:3005 stop:3802 length:798 start_codon:yes stop_codon:yes gene_type:complete
MKSLEIYCVTNKKLDFLERTPFKLVGVGNEKFSQNYIRCDTKDNIYYKEQYYSELTFHYWYWKNILPIEKNEWVGFCQKRRFWVKSEIKDNIISISDLNEFLLTDIKKEYNSYESFICNPIKISGAKKSKLIKRGWRNLVSNPLIFFKPSNQTIAIHFDMHHGFKNLNKAIELLDNENKRDFYHYVNSKDYYNPNIMCIARPEILDKWFKSLFPWLMKCEKEFGYEDLKGYDTQRLYAYLAERYLSYWFKKFTKYKELPWTLVDI